MPIRAIVISVLSGIVCKNSRQPCAAHPRSTTRQVEGDPDLAAFALRVSQCQGDRKMRGRGMAAAVLMVILWAIVACGSVAEHKGLADAAGTDGSPSGSLCVLDQSALGECTL